MKTLIAFLMLLSAMVVCCTNPNRPLSDSEITKIKDEVHVVMQSIISGAEEANFAKATEHWSDSPEITINYNGKSMNRKEFMEALTPLINSVSGQKAKFLTEKYSVVDNTTVVYSANSSWLVNLKDGSSILEEPWAMLYIFKKANGVWKLVACSESGIEKVIPAPEATK
jgi:hypothetical protein